jgi:hypothetical protein
MPRTGERKPIVLPLDKIEHVESVKEAPSVHVRTSSFSCSIGVLNGN